MKFNSLKSSILKQFKQPGGNAVVPFILGCPGGGKSACARAIANALAEEYDIPPERVVEFNPSLRDPVDILGVPHASEDGTHSEWLPPAEFWAIRKGQGPSILILEELSDASMAMQNPLCRVILDRHAGQLPLSEELFIIATGNRVEDKSGANRLSTKLGNRTRQLEFDVSVDDWVDWAISHGLPPMLIAFLKFKPNLLTDFDPKKTINPTPRSWEDVGRVPEDLPAGEFFAHIQGSVGEGPAVEYTNFLKLAQELPDIEEIVADPKGAPVPEKPSVLYALSMALATRMTKKTIKGLWVYLQRLPKEFMTVTIKAAMQFNGSEICKTREYTTWVREAAQVMLR